MPSPAYDWSCSACGASNSRDNRACAVCGCPFQSTVAQIESHRSRHLATGLPMRPGAADLGDPQETRTVAKAVLAVLSIVTFGIVPFPFGPRDRVPKTPGSR